MGEGREQNQTYPCQKPFPKCTFFLSFFFFGSYADKVALPSQTCHFPLLPCPGWGCSGHAQMHCCHFCFLKEGGILREGKYPTSTSNTQAACSSVQ